MNRVRANAMIGLLQYEVIDDDRGAASIFDKKLVVKENGGSKKHDETTKRQRSSFISVARFLTARTHRRTSFTMFLEE